MPKFDKTGKGKVRLSADQLNQIAGGRIALLNPHAVSNYENNNAKFGGWVDEMDPNDIEHLIRDCGFIKVDVDDSGDPIFEYRNQ